MIVKLLYTAAVIAVVYLVFRTRLRTAGGVKKPPVKPAPAEADTRIGRIAAYGFILLLIIISSVFYYFHWVEEHRIVTIRVIDGASGEATMYKAYRKSLKGNRFESLDGKTVILSKSERVELTEDE